MTLPASGSISLAQVRTEIGGSGSVVIPSTEVRTLTGVASGPITLPTDFYGKAWFSASASPTSLSGSGTAAGGAVTSGSSTVTVTGGTGTKTYAWEYVSGNASVLPVSASSATSAFAVGPGAAGTYNAVVRCQVTDGVGNITYTNNVSVSLTLS